MTPEEAGKAVIPERSAQTVRRWCKEDGLEFTKDQKNGALMISRYALRKFCKRMGIMMKGEGDEG